jgi:hypothetical protein
LHPASVMQRRGFLSRHPHLYKPCMVLLTAILQQMNQVLSRGWCFDVLSLPSSDEKSVKRKAKQAQQCA